ncbi:MAG: hypothetical protein ACE5JB_05920 [bacterium]
MILETVKKAELQETFVDLPRAAGNIWILRLLEAYGRDTELTITLPAQVGRQYFQIFLKRMEKLLQ